MEQPSDLQWDLVIKVKYGDTLRRIGAFVHGQLMDPNMSKLRAKIINLFKFSQDADLMLTYTDEDGDVVTLDDDHDLHDAVIGQHLNPFRITVQLKCASHDRIVEGTKLRNNSAVSDNSSLEQKESCNIPGGSDTVPLTLSSIDLNVDAQKSSSYPCGNFLTSTTTAFKRFEHKKEDGGSHLDGNFSATSAIVFPPNNPAFSEILPNRVPELANSMFGHPDIMRGGSIDKQSPTQAYFPSPSKTGINSHSEVPISKQVGVSPSEIVQPIIPMTHPYQQSSIYNENTQQTYHSIYNYAPHHTTGALKELDNHHSRHQFPLTNALHNFGARPPETKLDSRFIQDVTVLDGTMMPPSTHFTKIWRIHNNGTVAWPVGTQLVWVDGDKFGNQALTDLEIPPSGFPVDEELDIALNLTTPSRPGRYVSYWRMTSPTGQKFGERIWVLIQVDLAASAAAADASSFQWNLNLNLPPVRNGRNVSELIDIKTEPLSNGYTGTNVENSPSAPISDFVDGFSKYSPTGVDPDLASYPLIDLPASSSMVDTFRVVTAAASDDNVVEEALLKELEAMGFKQNDLNREILRRNEYDLEQSVDDLCDYAEWGPILSELHEMSTPLAENMKYAVTTVTKRRRIKRVFWK